MTKKGYESHNMAAPCSLTGEEAASGSWMNCMNAVSVHQVKDD